MTKILTKFFAVLLILSVGALCHANNMRFEHLQVESGKGIKRGKGENIGAVRAIVQDRDGFMWFGGENGLAKYDGHGFKLYTHDPDDSDSLSNQYIGDMMVDHSGVLWVATHSGLNIYDPSSDRFVHFRDAVGEGSLSGLSVNQVFEGASYKLYVATNVGLNIYSKDRSQVEIFSPNKEIYQALQDNGVVCVYQDSRGVLWVGSQGAGLIRYDESADSVQHFVSDETQPGTLSDKFINTIGEDSQGRIWVGTHGGGLNRLNEDGKTFTHYYYGEDAGQDATGRTISAIYTDHAGQLWVSVDGSGIAKFDPVTDTFSSYSRSQFDPYSISSHSVVEIFEDSNRDMWFGTFPEGVNYWNRSSSYIEAYYHSAGDGSSISHSAILDFFEDKDGDLWVGTEGGLNLFNKKEGTFTSYVKDQSNPQALNANAVLTIEEDKFGRMWLGTWAGGLHRFEKETGVFHRYMPDANDPKSLGSKYIWDLLSDSEGRLWVGSETAGLSLYDFEEDSFKRVVTVASKGGKNEVEFAWPIYEDSRGTIWLSSDREIERLRKGEEQFEAFDPFEEALGVDTRVLKIYEDSRSNLWFGTLDIGVVRFNLDTHEITHLNRDAGLPSNNIASILEDNDGYIWLTTTNGLAKIHPRTLRVTTYDEGDGLVGTNSIRDASYKDRDGHLYLGTTDGFNKFNPRALRDNMYRAPVVLTDFKVFHKSAVINGEGSPLTMHINRTRHIVLDNHQSAFSFVYSALSYRASYQNQYAYMLEGFDDNWIVSENDNSATYTNLDPGNYIFKVKGSNNDGLWNAREFDVHIKVLPPFWASGWAYLIYLVLLSLFLFLVYSIHARRRELQMEKEMNEQLVSLDNLKKEFISNTTHELKTPLNGIIGIAEAVLENTRDSDAGSSYLKSSLNSIIYSGKRLSNLVNDILDFSKLSVGSLSVELEAVDIREVSEEVLQIVMPQLEGRPITIINNIPQDLVNGRADKVRVYQILLNLMSNALKFTDSGEIELSAVVESPEILITVKDTGLGISDDKKELIFNMFQQADGSSTRSYEGIGLGLTIAHQVVKLLGGRMYVVSEEGEGAAFTFSLPIDDEVVLGQGADISTEGNTIGNMLPQRKLLIVDDDPVNRMVIRAILANQNYLVSEAEDGARALEVIQAQEEFDLLILDVMMPKMNGFELAVKIREKYSQDSLPIVFLTALDQEKDVKKGRESGGNDYLTKPVSKTVLVECVQKHLAHC